MASSAKEHNGTFKGPKSFQQTKKSWSAVISGGANYNSSVMSASPTHQSTGEPEPLTSSDASMPQVDHFSHKVARPFLKGTIPNSVLVDITQIYDRQKEFIVALQIYCEANTHLWAVSEHMRRDNNRIYAEISVSPTMYEQIRQQPALELENFDKPLMAYPTLSPSENIVKLSLSRSPAHYGRRDGGTTQLHDDMHHNLQKFGQLIDCGFVTGGSGVYAGGGYAVLAVSPKHKALEHSLNWTYHPIDFSSGQLLSKRDNVLSLTTWAAMPSYSKAAADAKAADDVNSQTEVNTSNAVPAQNAGAPLLAAGDNNSSSANPHRTRSTTVNSPPVIQPCKTCNGTDHKIRSSLRCLRNPKSPNFIPDAEWAQHIDHLIIAPKDTDAMDTDKMDTDNHVDDGSASMQN
ncbi:unnamed protein product [Mucor circinelloides]